MLTVATREEAAEMVAAIRELKGTVCRCGTHKRSGHTFCPFCFQKLPPNIRRLLYSKDNYLEHYRTACRLLDALAEGVEG